MTRWRLRKIGMPNYIQQFDHGISVKSTFERRTTKKQNKKRRMCGILETIARAENCHSNWIKLADPMLIWCIFIVNPAKLSHTLYSNGPVLDCRLNKTRMLTMTTTGTHKWIEWKVKIKMECLRAATTTKKRQEIEFCSVLCLFK